jgi:hypothetical protein
MKKAWLCLALLLIGTISFGQEPAALEQAIKDNNLRPKILKTPDLEVADAILFLETKIEEADRPYIRFFSTYALPEALRQDAVLALSFVIHSMVGIGKTDEDNAGSYYPLARIEMVEEEPVFVAYRKVTDTLWWIDIREYNWQEKSWELMSREDGYFVEPIVSHEKNGALRLLAGNAVVRADWFIVHASDVTQQTDIDSATRIYKEFVYPDGAPTTVTEFEKSWGLDNKPRSRQRGNEYYQLIVDSGIVSRPSHPRLLYGYRTELGWLYRTYDVKSVRGKRDYAERIVELKGKPPVIYDGGEIFATNSLYMQVYDLYAQDDSIVDFADASVVRHITDVIGDVRVRTPHSCYDCHAAGPIPGKNALELFIKQRGYAYTPKKADMLRIERGGLSGRFRDSIEDNQRLFARSLMKINGLKPEENIAAYLGIVSWYNKPLDLKQASLECGVTPGMFTESMAELLKAGEPIARKAWEAPSTDGRPGTFQHAMIIINGLTEISIEEVVGLEVYEVIEDDSKVMVGQETKATLKAGDWLQPNGKTQGDYLSVTTSEGITGWVFQDKVKKIVAPAEKIDAYFRQQE